MALVNNDNHASRTAVRTLYCLHSSETHCCQPDKLPMRPLSFVIHKLTCEWKDATTFILPSVRLECALIATEMIPVVQWKILGPFWKSHISILCKVRLAFEQRETSYVYKAKTGIHLCFWRCCYSSELFCWNHLLSQFVIKIILKIGKTALYCVSWSNRIITPNRNPMNLIYECMILTMNLRRLVVMIRTRKKSRGQRSVS